MTAASTSTLRSLLGRALTTAGLGLALIGGLRGAWRAVGELDRATGLHQLFRQTEEQRIHATLEALRPGTGDLWREHLRQLPADVVLLGLFPTADDAERDPSLAEDRDASATVLQELQLLLYPRQVLSAAAQHVEVTPAWSPPEGLRLARFYLLDLAHPRPADLARWPEVAATPGGRLLSLAPGGAP